MNLVKNIVTETGYCPCCGYHTLDEGHLGMLEICEICGWNDIERSDYNIKYGNHSLK
jgi:uncharacterized protein (DUF983 family)